MLTYTYKAKGEFGFVEKAKPRVLHERDAVVTVATAKGCSENS